MCVLSAFVSPVLAYASEGRFHPAMDESPEAPPRQEAELPRAVSRRTSVWRPETRPPRWGCCAPVAREDDRDPHIAFALGRLLARTAPIEETDFKQRMEAEALLNQAYEGLHEDAGVLLELAFLRRRQFMRVDARRLLERTLAPERSRALEPQVLADAHFVLARILTEEMEDFEHLVFMPADWRRDGSVGDG